MALCGINDSGSLWTGMLRDVHGYAESIQANSSPLKSQLGYLCAAVPSNARAS
jgi:hypothetical protein